MEPHVDKVIPSVAFAFIALCVVLTFALQGGGGAEAGEPLDPLVRRGRDIYRRVCLQCHHADPRRDGSGSSPGPAIAGSSLELLEARVLRKEYPAGYKPKRDTQLMTAFPELKDEIGPLHAFLQWAKDRP